MHNKHPLLFNVVFLSAAAAAISRMTVEEGLLLRHQGSSAEPPDSMQAQQGFVPAGEQASTFSAVESGILNSHVGSISSCFGTRVFIQLRGTDGGYFSAGQSYYILETFFRGKRTMSARFTTYGTSDASPYATGSASFIVKGKREDAQMYVALSQAGEHWVISHLSIY
jgi:hypothetical protein